MTRRRRFRLFVRVASVRVGFLLGRLTGRPAGVLLATAHSDALSGNLACIRDELVRRGLPSTTLAYRPPVRRSFRGKTILKHVEAGFRLARARLVVVDDYFFPLYVVQPRPGTSVAQVWHACGAFKKFGYSVLDKRFGADEELVARVRIHSNYDVCLVSSAAATPAYAEAFRQPPELFVSELGIPRTDVLAAPDRDERAAAVRERYGIAADRRVILYAPTFRGAKISRARSDALPDFGVLGSALAADHVVLLRVHPFVRHRVQVPPELAGFVVDVSDAPEINELMPAADVLVTDYSSVVFEFALLGRPIVLFAPDVDAYVEERDFYLDFRADMPGPVTTTTEELAAVIGRGEFDLERVRAFADRWFDVADGRSTARFVDLVVEPALAGRKVTAEGLRTAAAAAAAAEAAAPDEAARAVAAATT